MTVENKQYVCEVILPEHSPVLSATGKPSSRKSVARRSAAFEACIQLRKGGHLDEHLIPTCHKQLPAMRNAHLALNLKQTNSYKVKIKPSVWEASRGVWPHELFLTILEVELPENLGKPYQPLALLTRTRLPDFPSILLHLQVDRTSHLRSTSIRNSFKVTEQSLAELNKFTLRIYKDIFNKTFEDNIAEMSYWLAPIIANRIIDREENVPESLIDWPIVDEVFQKEELGWDLSKPHSYLANRYFVDKWDGGRRFFSEKVLPDMRPNDPVPRAAAPHKYNNSILDYSITLFKNSRMKASWSPDQPVILAHRVLHRLNVLDTFTEQEKDVPTTSYICPEPLLISAVSESCPLSSRRTLTYAQLPITVVTMCYLFPATLSRFESYLIALEACSLLGLEVKLDLALEAITKDSDNTEENRAKQLHLQRGMGKNYERLEFIGDCFLKMATSIALFSNNPENNEYEYHVKRMLLICNKNLFGTALKLELYQYIRTTGFSR